MTTLQDVSRLANDYLDRNYTITTITGKTFKYCPRELGYRFEFNNRKNGFGICNFRRRIIGLSKGLCEFNLDKIETHITDTILHEIAHALSYEVYGFDGRGHDFKWVSIAKQIGCNGKRCFSIHDIESPPSKYTLTCPTCKRETPKHRKPKRSKACGKCCNGVYQEEHKLIVTQNY